MATGRLLDSNRDNSGDFIGECTISQSCEPCIKSNKSKTATGFCKECDYYLCDTCINQHTLYTPGKHDIIRVQNRKSVRVEVDMKGMEICQEHGKEIQFFCRDHSKLCCNKCKVIHKRCDSIEKITGSKADTWAELQALTQSLFILESSSDAIIGDCKNSEKGLNESIAKMSSEVDKMRDRIIKIFDEAKTKLLNKAAQIKTAEVRRIGNKIDASSKVKEEINQVVPICCAVLERGTATQQYIYSKMIQEKYKKMESNINEQRTIKIASTVTLCFPKELTTLLQMGNTFIKLNCDGGKTVETSPINLSLQPRPLTLELILSVDVLKSGDDEAQPLLSGLDFLPDGRLVAVDNKNKKCFILNERLQRLRTPHKLKFGPLDVVCLSQNELAITSGSGVCLLSVSTDNIIRLTRTIKTSSQFYSICCESPSNMVLSAFNDHRPARMVSVDGVESDFDHVTFPMVTYKLNESRCTYVQSKNTLVLTDKYAHAVYLYDIMKGTSRVVTDEKIEEPSSACVGPGGTVLVCSENKNCIVHMTVNGVILGIYPVQMRGPYSINVSKDGTRLAVSNSADDARKFQLYKIHQR